jgi:cytochrome c oxidase subunit 2
MWKRLLATVFLISLISMLSISSAYEEHKSHQMTGKHHHQVTKQMHDFGVCPVMGGEANEEYSYVYEGKTYYFCCPMCIEKFKNDPQKYISKIKQINLEAYQFGFSPQVIEVKKGDILKIFATSRDVPHGIYIKEYGINTVVKKGQTKKIEFVAGKQGEFDILCSVYCGKGHNTMKAKLVVKQ